MPLNPRDAVIIDAVRTPMGRSRGGCFRHRRAEDLSADVMRALLVRNPTLDPAELDDVLWGCVNQIGEQGWNVARMAALLADIPYCVGAQTINRLCGSSMAALHSAAQAIQSGQGDVFLVGGVEHMGHIDMLHGFDLHPALPEKIGPEAVSMGLTAEKLARLHNVSREAQDAFAARSQQRACLAADEGYFSREIIAVAGHDAAGEPCLIQRDETLRPHTEAAQLATLRPVFDAERGRITAGNASQVSDGAAGLLVVSAARARAWGMVPLAKVRAMAVVGVEPSLMGYGPVPASRKALARAGLSMAEMDCVEINEAFAAQTLPVLNDLQLLDALNDKVNLWGGAIALGHPLGASGARITGTLLNVMRQKEATFGLASLCIGFGQGIATVLERL